MNEEGTRRYMRVYAKSSRVGRERIAQYRKEMRAVLERLIYEGAMNYMTTKEMAEELGMTQSSLRTAMRRAGLPGRVSVRQLAKSAADALRGNAAALGVKPWQMDLRSPLAYLPMGSKLQQSIIEQSIVRVTDIPETVPLPTHKQLTEVLVNRWLLESEAGTVDSPEGHCSKMAGDIMSLLLGEKQ